MQVELFERFAQASNLRELLDGMSLLAGGPVLVTDPSGRLLCLPSCHPDSCPLLEGQSMRSPHCPVAQKVAEHACNGARSPVVMRFHGVRHVVSSIQGWGRLLGFVIAEERSCGPLRGPSSQSLRHLRLGATLLSKWIERVLAYIEHGPALHSEKTNGQDALDGQVLEELAGCRRASTREILKEAILARKISPHGVARLRREFGLTWREVEVFVRYYLFPHQEAIQNGNARRSLARHLGITEGTLRVYLNEVRSKLSLQARRGSLSILLWAREERIAPSDILS